MKILKRNYKESLIEITLRQGLNRQIRRMLAKVGFKVKSLKRTKLGKITTKGLGVGKSRRKSQIGRFLPRLTLSGSVFCRKIGFALAILAFGRKILCFTVCRKINKLS